MNTPVHVALGERSYDIVIGSGLMAQTGALLAPLLRAPRVIIVTDSTVAKHYLEPLNESLKQHNLRHEQVILPAGEATKSFRELETLLEKLLSFNPDRHTTIVALGGGVIGDIAGFAASILLRGIDFIQIPTTLLSQVDSSVGGKTGINSSYGKNLIGTFYQPRAVLIDTQVLRTLPSRELLAGYAEVVKYGIINDAAFFTWLEEHGAQGLSGDEASLTHMIRSSCQAKADIVAQDERESGRRALLNFGHTLGHALEAETGYSDRLLHGEAVALGMLLALKLSVLHKRCSLQDYERVRQHFLRVGLKTSPLDIQRQWDTGSLITHCYHDKKALQGRLTFILAEKIGKTFISHDVKKSDLEVILAEALRIG